MLFLFVLAVLAALSSAAPADQLITNLPGAPSDLGFKQYAGYVDLPKDRGETALFYWFVESQSDPVNDPLLVWFNGGPGASSVGDGFFLEHGPFRINPDGKTLSLYPYAWNQKASVIYVESPSGVGFSYSNDTSHYVTNDTQTAIDAHLFLKGWFAKFPEYAKNDFYITGESYGGHYVPELAAQIIETGDSSINVKGLLIGNPGIEDDWYFNVNEYAFITFLWSHGLVPQHAYVASVKACGWDEFLTNCKDNYTQPSAACQAATNKALTYIPKVWDPYDVLAPTCHKNRANLEAARRAHEFVAKRTPFLERLNTKYNLGIKFDPCLGDYSHVYLNQPEVQAALHVKPTKWPGPGIDYTDTSENIVPYFKEFFDKVPDWRITIMSGTADSAVPFIGTQRWIDCLDRPVVNDWHDWMLNQDVAGAQIDFDRISFVTAKGCGHMIPWYCPEKGYALLQNYLEQSH